MRNRLLGGHGKAFLYRNGKLIQTAEASNLVPDAALTHALAVAHGGDTKKAAWYLAPLDTNHTPTAADTYANSMATTAYESTDYSELVRQTWTPGAVSGQSVDNSASVASYTMAGNDTTIYGMALVSDSTKNDTAASGAVMYSIILFSTAITGIEAGDVLKLQYTATASSTLTSGFLYHDEGLDHILDVVLCNGTQYATQYLAPLDTDYTQLGTGTYATVMGTTANESTDYSEATRPTCQFGTAASQSISNSANLASITLAGNDTPIYGHALVTTATKGDTASGVLLSTYKYTAAKAISIADTTFKMTQTVTAA